MPPSFTYSYEDKLSLTAFAFPTTPILENFNRADSDPINGPWALMDTGNQQMRILSGQAAASTTPAGNSKTYYTATTFGPDIDIYMNVPVKPADNQSFGLWGRIVSPDTASFGGYIFFVAPVAGTDQYIFAKTINAVYQGAAVTITGPEFSSGNKLGMRIQGSVITGYVYQNGAWKSVGSWTDTSFTAAGYIGMELKDNAGPGRADDFGGGTLPSANLVNPFTSANYSNLGGDDGDYFIQYGSEYMIQEYKRQGADNTSTPQFTWRGRSTSDTSSTPFLVQIFNVSSGAWETLATVNKIPADTDFSVSVSQTTSVSSYYDSSNMVSFRIYQQVI